MSLEKRGGGKFYRKPFLRHPKGFDIFLPQNRVTVSDEYKDSDPYCIEKTIRNDFQKRRMDLTINLLQQAVSTVQGLSRILDIGCGQGHITQAMYSDPILVFQA